MFFFALPKRSATENRKTEKETDDEKKNRIAEDIDSGKRDYFTFLWELSDLYVLLGA